ncbi:MarR family transcriptional regulator [uncultured Christiangramia sp.]|uniref:MarR family winged helix-turn-helix transcriptional regulator n=1 Tax=Christiangramia sp. 3-2217-3z TaxID=3417564 RepID=UPI0025E1AB46|nr:MarR family transcriptional regulator [uncultured Christiangramia sp.]|tara:strand:- start:535 stop:993 length:459 start_codon:yes stop_codon:yes gene_type:complete
MKIEDLLKTSGKISETKRLVLNLIVTANFLSEEMQEVLKPYGISSQQFNVLRILRGQKGKPANLGTIQERMVSKMSNTTRLVDKLIEKGFCQRITCPSNRRKVEITITEAGQELLKEIDPLVESMENRFSEKLTTKELTDLNNKLNELRNTN